MNRSQNEKLWIDQVLTILEKDYGIVVEDGKLTVGMVTSLLNTGVLPKAAAHDIARGLHSKNYFRNGM